MLKATRFTDDASETILRQSTAQVTFEFILDVLGYAMAFGMLSLDFLVEGEQVFLDHLVEDGFFGPAALVDGTTAAGQPWCGGIVHTCASGIVSTFAWRSASWLCAERHALPELSAGVLHGLRRS